MAPALRVSEISGIAHVYVALHKNKRYDLTMDAISRSFHASETLPDGRVVHLRPIRPSDQAMLRTEFHRLSPESVRNRFFYAKPDLTPKELEYFTNVDLRHHVALVAEMDPGQGRHPVGVGRFVEKDDAPGHAEMAITIADDMQGVGLGKIFLRQLLRCANELDVERLDATVFAENTPMAKLLRHAGLPLESQIEDGVLTLSLTLRAPDGRAQEFASGF
jgi:RimJ/RimL family protein N-acetyltransferase